MRREVSLSLNTRMPNLFRRRQFILGPEYVAEPGWVRLDIGAMLVLSAHPDLPLVSQERGDRKVVLLGYLMDPTKPEVAESDIVDEICQRGYTVSEAAKRLDVVSGRFALLIKSSEGCWILHDACGLRQVNYCQDSKGRTWCASDPAQLADWFQLAPDPAVFDYRESFVSQKGVEEFWMLHERTPFRKVHYLLPNHYLDLEKCKAVRYWPRPEGLEHLSRESAVRQCAPIIENSIRAAADRFELKMGITAGSDSRRSLAGCRSVLNKIEFFTHTPRRYHPDLEVPARLLGRFEIPHRRVELQEMSDEFEAVHSSNSMWARPRRGKIAYTILQTFGPDATLLNSNISEISQCWYWLPKKMITGEGLAIATGLNHPLARNEFQKWLDSAQPACAAAGINVLVLFDYELRSRWVSGSLAEYDVAHETFIPYNNRYLFSLELSVTERYRRGRRLDFLKDQIRFMWPELLEEPINPPEQLSTRMKEFVLRSIVHRFLTPWIPVDDYFRYLEKRRRYFSRTVV